MKKNIYILFVVILFALFSNSEYAAGNKNNIYKITPPPKSITVTSPNNGEIWMLDSSHNITWTSSGISTIRIELSTDGGSSWQTIVASQNASAGTFTWNINSTLYTPTMQAIIKIFDISDITISDVSDNLFTLSKLQILSPTQGTKFQANTNAEILWSSSSDISSINLEYSTDGIVWNSIANNVSANLGAFTWFVPNTPTATAFIRITDSNNPSLVSLISSQFIISYLQLLTPNGGETWFGGNTQTINWNSNTINNINIYYSTDNGFTWIPDTTVSASSQNLSWVVPSVQTNEALLKIEDADANNIFDKSDNKFTINSISIVTPNGNEGWEIGTNVSINWTSNIQGNVDIELSTDQGVTWGQTIVSGIAATSGNYNLTVPNTPTNQALIKILNSADKTQFDSSSSSFTIGKIALLRPLAGETLQSGNVYNILWNATAGINNVKIEYTLDGINYTTITTSANAQSGNYSWLVPTGLSGSNVKIRISDPNTGLSISDISNSFSITSLQITYPVGGELWQQGTVQNIIWSNSADVSQLSIDYSTDGGNTWSNIVSSADASLGLYQWNLPANLNSNQMKIRLSAVSSSAVSISNSNFKIGDVKLLSPNGGEKIFANSSFNITWNATSSINFVNLQYSLDNGATFNNIADSVSAASGSYKWTIPPSIFSNNAIIRIYDSDGLDIADTSNLSFTVENLKLISPNGGEGFFSGAPITVSWTSNLVNNVKIEYSPDGINYSTSVITSGAAQTYTWNLSALVTGETEKAKIRISDADNPVFFDSSNSYFTIERITVISPNGNEIFQSGKVHPITWYQSFLNHNITIDYSTNSGLSWNTIVANQAVQSPYNWTIPNTATTNTLVRVSNSNFSNIADTSDSSFSIKNLQLVSPNGGEYFLVDSTASITWRSANINNLKIEYSINNGLIWNTIASSIPAASGVYNWKVPNTPSKNVLVKISDADNPADNITDQSNNSFVISVLNLILPNGGENFVVNSAQTIKWISHSSVAAINLEFSANGGTSWSTIASGINASQQSYGWIVPNTATSNGFIRIIDAANTSVIDTSDAAFSIGSIQLIAPNGGERFQIDSSTTIRWNNISSVSFINLYYSTDNGTNWTIISSNVSANLEKYVWTIPNTPTAYGLIKVEDASNNTIFDKSNSVFTISNLHVISPNNGEVLHAGTISNIKWNSSFVNNIDIDLSLDNGLTWSNIASSISANLNSFSFTVPNTTTSNGIIRITDSSNPLITDRSDNTFIIEKLDLTFPVGGEGITSGSIVPISWSSGNLGNINIDFSTDSGITWTNIISNISSSLGSYKWTVPNIAAKNAKIKVYDSNNNYISDSSKNDFIIGKISIAQPSTGLSWQAGSVQNIIWTASSSLESINLEYTTNNLTWNVIANNYNASLGNYTWTIPSGISTTQARIKILDANKNSTITDSTGLFIINSLRLNSPNGGDYVASGSVQRISWTSSNIANLNIQYSVDNGSSWNVIVSSTAATTGFYNWTVPSTLSSKSALIKISDASNFSVNDSSDAVFNLGWVKYISPTAGTFLQSGKTVAINWSNSNSVDNISIDYSTDGGTSWANITSTATASAGSYNWNVPNSLSTNNLKLRVSDAASSLSIMDVSGLLNVSYLNLLAPVGGENWLEGSTQNISWNSGSLISSINIDYSIDNGISWNNIAKNILASTSSYSWLIPKGISSNISLIRIVDANNLSIRDSSRQQFEISKLNLLFPAGGENWLANTSQNIIFTSNLLPSVNIDFSTDNGVSWKNIITNLSTANDTNSYSWNIPSSVSSTQAKVRVASSGNASQVKESNVFSITKLNLIKPIGSENWQAGTTQSILWESGNVAQINLYYSVDNGISWNLISQNINALVNQYDWNIPAGITTNGALIKIEDSNNTSFNSISNGVFSISSLILTSPGIGEQLQTGNSSTIRWQGDSSIQNVDLEYSTDSGISWNTIATNILANTGAFNWSIPNVPSDKVIVRVLDSANRAISSESGLFTLSSLKLLKPDGSYFINSGKPATITWNSSFVSNISIDFSTDNGLNWSNISSSVPASQNKFIWNVPSNIFTDNALIKIYDASNKNITSISNSKFRVGKLVLTFPNGGEFLTAGSNSNITWTNSSNINNISINYSTNSGTNWAPIISSTNAANGNYKWNIPVVSSSNVLIRINDVESADSLFDVSDNSFTLTTLAITAPNGGENIKSGNSYNIKWVAGLGISNVKLEYLDNTSTWQTIANNVTASAGNYLWTVPNINSNNSLLRVSSTSGAILADSSDGTFRIAQLDLTSPNGNEIWQSGTNHKITWTNSSNVTNVDIYYSTDSGANWNTVVLGANSSSPYNWTLPDVASVQTAVKIVDANSNNEIIDSSNSVFTISRLKIMQPIGGENIIAGSVLNIKWNYSADISTIDLAFTTDGGTTWNTIQNNVPASSGNFNWNIPPTLNSANSALLIKNSANSSVADTSGIFNIYQAGFSLVSPNGNEYIQAGKSADITWVNGTSVKFVNIYYSLNSGKNWINIVNNYDASLSSYKWKVPDIFSDNSRIKIIDSNNLVIRDSSDLDFSIRKLNLLSPNGGEILQANTLNNILWTNSSNVKNIKIELSTDSGNSWLTVNSPVAAGPGTYTWLVNNIPTTNALIKISDVSAGKIVDTSSSAFIISQLLLTYPNGGERIKANDSVNLTWVSSADINQVKLEYSTNGVNWNSITSGAVAANLNSFQWLVPDNLCSTTGYVRISNFQNLSVNDVNDAPFKFSTLDILAPVSGQVWTFGTAQNINWQSCDIQKVKLEYSVDAGLTWITIVDSTPAVSQTYLWTIPNITSKNALLRISDANNIAFSTVSKPFVLSSPTLLLVAPKAGDNWQSGSAQIIRWLPTSISFVNILFSKDAGSTWQTLIGNVPAADSQYVWNIPDSIETNSAIIKIVDNSGNIKDSTQGTFTISKLVLTSPIGGEFWQSGTKQNITWSSGSSVNSVKLQYSLDFGKTWINIAGANNLNASSGTYMWNLPINISSDSAKIRINDINQPSIVSQSNNPIKFGWVKVISPNGGEIIQAGKKLDVIWNNSNSVKNVSIQLINLRNNSIIFSRDTAATAKKINILVPKNSFTDSAIVKVSDSASGNAIKDFSDNALKIVSLNILEPITNTNWQAGTKRAIKWTSNNLSGTITIQYSADNGNSWNNIITGVNITDNNYNWTIPANLVSNTSKIRIIDDTTPSIVDTSGSFNIFISALTLNSPKGGEYFNSTDSISISWSSTFVSSIKIDFSPDSGKTWTTIASSVLTNSQIFKWKPPTNLSTNSAMIKISDVTDSTLIDSSSNTFTIGWINIISPNGGETIIAGKTLNINWESSGSVSNINLYYTTVQNPADSNWIPIALNLPNGTRLFNWNNIPNTEINNIRIVASDANSRKKLFSYSNVFNIKIFKLLSPNGGETWQSGQTRQIKWITSNSIKNISIQYSINNGKTWEPSITNFVSASDSSFGWKIPQGVNSDSALVRIIDVVNNQIADTSDTVFQIGDLSLLSFNGGEKVLENTRHAILWSKGKNTEFVNLEYKLSNNSSWIRIVSSYPADSLKYLWDIPTTPSDSCFIRISDANNSIYSDVSNTPFTIVRFNLLSLNGGEVIQTGTTENIKWESKYIKNISIDYTTTDSIWLPISTQPVNAGLSSFSWNIPDNINFANTNYKIRLRDISNNSILIKSKNSFTISHIKLLQPNGGGGQQVGTEYNVTWIASSNTISQVNLFVKTTNTGDFVRINSSPINASSGKYLWHIATAASPNSQIKITDAAHPAIFDVSDSLFTISEIKLEFPNGGKYQKFQIGRNYDIMWSSKFVNNIRLEYKLNDNSAQWLLMNGGASVDASLGKFNWDITSGLVIPSRTARVRVSDADFATVRDISDTTFIICSLKLDSPNERIPLKTGTITNITWSSVNVDSIMIFLNPGNGLPLLPIAGPIDANNNNSYQWKIPVNLISGNAKIRITDFDDTNIYDESDTTFVIGAFPKFNVSTNYQTGIINIPWEFSTPNETISIINVTYQKLGSAIVANGADALIGDYQNMVGPIESDTIKWNSKAHLDKYEGLVNLQFKFKSDFNVIYTVTIDSFGIDNLAPRFNIGSMSFATNKFKFGWDKVLSSWMPASDTSKPVSYALYLSDTKSFETLPTIATKGDTAIFRHLSTSKTYFVKLNVQDNLGNTSTFNYDFKTNTAADYNDDNIIDGADLSAFVKSWSNTDSLVGADFFPYTDTIPTINVEGDLLLDVNDILVFVNMWNYYQVNRVLPKVGAEYFADDNVERRLLKIKNGENNLSIHIPLKQNNSNNKTAFAIDLYYDNSIIHFDSLKILNNGKIEKNGLTLSYIDSVKGQVHIDYANLSGRLKDNYEVITSINYMPQDFSAKDSILVKVKAYNQYLKKENIKNYVYSMIEVPRKFALYQNYPNPFNPSTTIVFDLPQKEKVLLEVYDILGRKMATLINEVKDAGHYIVQFNSRKSNRRLSSGVYLYRIIAGRFSKTKKMVLLK